MTVEYIQKDDDPYLSVVIPTLPRNDTVDLEDALLNQTYDGAYEVLLIRDAGLNTVEARNEGIEKASGEVICNTDDDCIPAKDWLSEISSNFKHNKNLVLLEGRITGGLSHDGGRLYPTANLSYRRYAALNVGGFSKDIVGWREDTAFGWKVEEVGEYSYDQDVLVEHEPNPRHKPVLWNDIKLRRRHTEKYRQLIERNSFAANVYHWMSMAGFTRTTSAAMWLAKKVR
jgi:glycosyltransferase involved in cell wall biosynthesis